MPNLLSQLSRSAQARLLDELNYMNLQEIRGFCSARGIPFRIVAEYPDGKLRTTKDTDRKPIVLARVRRYLTTGRVGQPALHGKWKRGFLPSLWDWPSQPLRMCDHERARTSTRFKERPLNQFPPDDIPPVSNYPWRSGDHRLVLADFLVAEAQRLLGRAEVLLSEVEAAGGVTKGNIHSKRVY